MPSSSQVGMTSVLDDPPQHGVLRLVGDQLDAELLRERVAGADLLGGPLADADVERLAVADHVGERLHGLLERRLVVVPVRLVEVDVVGAEPLSEPLIDSMMCLRDRPVSLWPAGAGRPVDLGEDLQRLAALALERLAEHRLGLGVGVDVGGVERGDARVEGRPYACRRRVVLDLGAVREPVAVDDFADLEAAVAEVSEVHGFEPSGSGPRRACRLIRRLKTPVAQR